MNEPQVDEVLRCLLCAEAAYEADPEKFLSDVTTYPQLVRDSLKYHDEFECPKATSFRFAMFRGSMDSDGITPLFVAFRGTRGANWEDWWQVNVVTLGFFLDQGMRGAFHRGFYETAMYSPLDYFYSLIAGEESKYRLVFCGHSLGGAVASITALRMLLKAGDADVREKISCITFAQPLLCSAEAAQSIATLGFERYFHSYLFDSDPIQLLALGELLRNTFGDSLVRVTRRVLRLKLHEQGKQVLEGCCSPTDSRKVQGAEKGLREILAKVTTGGIQALLDAVYIAFRPFGTIWYIGNDGTVEGLDDQQRNLERQRETVESVLRQNPRQWIQDHSTSVYRTYLRQSKTSDISLLQTGQREPPFSCEIPPKFSDDAVRITRCEVYAVGSQFLAVAIDGINLHYLDPFTSIQIEPLPRPYGTKLETSSDDSSHLLVKFEGEKVKPAEMRTVNVKICGLTSRNPMYERENVRVDVVPDGMYFGAKTDFRRHILYDHMDRIVEKTAQRSFVRREAYGAPEERAQDLRADGWNRIDAQGQKCKRLMAILEDMLPQETFQNFEQIEDNELKEDIMRANLMAEVKMENSLGLRNGDLESAVEEMNRRLNQGVFWGIIENISRWYTNRNSLLSSLPEESLKNIEKTVQQPIKPFRAIYANSDNNTEGEVTQMYFSALPVIYLIFLRAGRYQKYFNATRSPWAEKFALTLIFLIGWLSGATALVYSVSWLVLAFTAETAFLGLGIAAVGRIAVAAGTTILLVVLSEQILFARSEYEVAARWLSCALNVQAVDAERVPVFGLEEYVFRWFRDRDVLLSDFIQEDRGEQAYSRVYISVRNALLENRFDAGKKKFNRVCEFVTFMLCVHEARRVLMETFVVGVIGPTNSGKSTLLKAAWNLPTEPNRYARTTKVQPYAIGREKKMIVIDYPGFNTIDSRVSRTKDLLLLSDALVIIGHIERHDDPSFARLTKDVAKSGQPCLLVISHADELYEHVADTVDGKINGHKIQEEDREKRTHELMIEKLDEIHKLCSSRDGFLTGRMHRLRFTFANVKDEAVGASDSWKVFYARNGAKRLVVNNYKVLFDWINSALESARCKPVEDLDSWKYESI